LPRRQSIALSGHSQPEPEESHAVAVGNPLKTHGRDSSQHGNALSVRPSTSGGITESSEHEADRGETEERKRAVVTVFPISGQTSASVEPCDRPFDDPSLGFDDEALGVLASLDDFHRQARHRLGSAGMEDWSRIGAVGEQFAQEGELPEQGGQQQHATIAVLNVGRSDQRVQHQTERVDEQMALLALDQLAAIEARRVDNRAPFSALLTLWLSSTQAVGLISRPACSRHLT
jgi:hypothetical protein